MAKRKKSPTAQHMLRMEKRLVLIPDRESASAIVSALKRTFSRSPMVRDFLKKHRREEPWIKKDGTKAKKPRVFYRCAQCKKEFSSTQVQIDHIEPCVPLNIPSRHMSYNMLVDRIFCDESNLQILCKEHHAEKSKRENETRKEWLNKTKYIVYETTNTVNNKRYIGVHKCDDYDDFYLGSGTLLKQAIAKYGEKFFYRTILFVFDDAESAYNKEAELVTNSVCESTEYYNVALGGKCGSAGLPAQRIICHQSGHVFESLSRAARSIGTDAGNISKVINNPDHSIKGLHFFTTDMYNPNMPVYYPDGASVVCLNNKTKYTSIRQAAEKLCINYKSLRNALCWTDEDSLRSLNGYYFLYEFEYDPRKEYAATKRKVRCVDLKKTFNSLKDAARAVKAESSNAPISISKACREGVKMYGYRWEYVYVKEKIS